MRSAPRTIYSRSELLDMIDWMAYLRADCVEDVLFEYFVQYCKNDEEADVEMQRLPLLEHAACVVINGGRRM